MGSPTITNSGIWFIFDGIWVLWGSRPIPCLRGSDFQTQCAFVHDKTWQNNISNETSMKPQKKEDDMAAAPVLTPAAKNERIAASSDGLGPFQGSQGLGCLWPIRPLILECLLLQIKHLQSTMSSRHFNRTTLHPRRLFTNINSWISWLGTNLKALLPSDLQILKQTVLYQGKDKITSLKYMKWKVRYWVWAILVGGEDLYSLVEASCSHGKLATSSN